MFPCGFGFARLPIFVRGNASLRHSGAAEIVNSVDNVGTTKKTRLPKQQVSSAVFIIFVSTDYPTFLAMTNSLPCDAPKDD